MVGAGPAGLCASIEAARAGLLVALVDENPAPGGQIYRPLPSEFSPRSRRALGRDASRARPLLDELESLAVRGFFGTTVWGAFDANILEAAGPTGVLRIEAQAVIVATGAHDRPVPLPGWTLPGVLTVGGAQTLLKSQRVMPGRRLLFAGTGPLLLVVAAQYADAGAEIAALVEAATTRALFGHIPALIGCPGLLLDGARYRWSLLRKRIPWLAPQLLVRVEGKDQVEAAVVAEVGDDGNVRTGTERTIDADTVCIGYGLVPSVELLGLLGCRLRYDEASASWIPERRDDCQTTRAGVYAAGDGAGVAGAAVAADEGRIAGIACAQRLGRLTEAEAERRQRPYRARLARFSRFRVAMDDVYRLPLGVLQRATRDTIVCRCEDVRLSEIEAAIADGAATAGQVKAWTRAGMGPCQGRMCFLPTVQTLSRATGRPVAELGPFSVRPPIKPVPIQSLVADEDERSG